MGFALNFFPVVTQELLEKIGVENSDYQFEYNCEGIKNKLNSKPADGHDGRSDYLLISDDKNEWAADIHDLCFKRKYKINNPRFIFGENGLACEDAELGIALSWASKASNQRGIKIISGFRQTDDAPICFEIESAFPPGQLKGIINFQTILFLKTPGKSKNNEKHLASSAGINLGVLDEYTMVIDGNGSTFPIVEVSEESQPLWWVNCDWTDPLVDSFDEENVSICLNKAHSNYQLLKLEDGLKESPMLMEIIASAMQIIVQKVKESDEWQDVITGQNMETGSIAQAINYFISTFNWDIQSPEKLARSIRKDFDTRI